MCKYAGPFENGLEEVISPVTSQREKNEIKCCKCCDRECAKPSCGRLYSRLGASYRRWARYDAASAETGRSGEWLTDLQARLAVKSIKRFMSTRQRYFLNVWCPTLVHPTGGGCGKPF